MKKVDSRSQSVMPPQKLIPLNRSATTFGASPTFCVSTRTARRQNQREITSGTSRRKKLVMENGSSDLSTESSRAHPLVSLTVVCAGRGHRVSGTLKPPGRTCPLPIVLQISLPGSRGRMIFFLESLPLMLRTVPSQQTRRLVYFPDDVGRKTDASLR